MAGRSSKETIFMMVPIILAGILTIAIFVIVILLFKIRELNDENWFLNEERKHDREDFERKERKLLVRILAANIHLYEARRERNEAYRNLEMTLEHKDPVPIVIPTKQKARKR
jgi:biopolymer transport protein ExbB/TolQ